MCRLSRPSRPEVVIGVDPGKKGGVAVIKNREVAVVFKRDEVEAFKDFIGLAVIHKYEINAFIEKVHSMPGQGVRSMFSFGAELGFWEGLFSGLGIDIHYVAPQVWQKIILPMAGKTTKEKSIRFASCAFPGVSLIPAGHRKPQDGLADALCIAYWGKKVLEQKQKNTGNF